MRKLILVAMACLSVGLSAQHEQPYKGEEKRRIKALSDADVDGLREGKGMGLAKAAELNRYPGPMHVLQLGRELGLSTPQKARIESEMAVMRRRAKALGKKILEKEVALDREFASGKAEVRRVRRLSKEIGALQGDLRLSHLEAHLAMKKVLTPQQITAYVRLRGYGGPSG